ncbi:MAG: hypothetical protein M1540_08590 [Candidatus Bathyarchaeota archaeon]|nr:hypothetical protein [Candidatus Bathyarchaeota archaeon]
MRHRKIPHKNIVATIILVLTISPLFIAQASSLQLITTNEYTQHVYTYINSERGNYTQIDKPIFPVMINNSQIQIGENWTITCPLEANHNYHVYCYGTWVDTSSAAKTDYDIYVYDPSGNLESPHTEAAGFPEHLGTTSDEPLFTPKQSGNYSFMIKNDARESQGTQQATFMVIENLECNKWHTSFVEGKDDNSQPSFRTSWSYEFVTNETKVEVYLKIPKTLDMYEARLYLMSGANSPSINDFPLPWEPGLFANTTGVVGGYNFESEGYRGVSYASCEYMGQDMLLNYTTSAGIKLYHLVLIGEDGSGDVEFLIKTRFEEITLTPVIQAAAKVLPDEPVPLSFQSDGAAIRQANLSYTTDDWVTTSLIQMEVSNQTCNATIPGRGPGAKVQYRVDAIDIIENQFSTSGGYTVKAQPTLTITLSKEEVVLGQNVTLIGTLTPFDNQSVINVQYFNSNSTETISCPVAADGTFTINIQPTDSGTWAILAESPETETLWKTGSPQFLVNVKEPPLYVKYSLYIIIGLVVSCAVGGVVWFLKFRNK